MMGRQPTIETDKLILRPFAISDAPEVQRLAGDEAIASTTINIPHPYEDGAAEAWISKHAERYASGDMCEFAITLRDNGALIGAIMLAVEQRHSRAELGYWIGVPYWGNGYCTEAARAMLEFGFNTLGLNRIHAVHFARNPASGRVLQKIGLRREGCFRQHVLKWDRFEDLEVYGILRDDCRSG